jgi:2-C-methyl-D-erythritol 4-phosphate cytidylyltransferase
MGSEIQLAVVLPAAGLGARLPGQIKKQFRKIDGKEIFILTLKNILKVRFLKEIVFVASKEDFSGLKKILNQYYPSQFHMIQIVEGGATRQKSVLNGLKVVSKHINTVAIHDAVRPFASTQLFDHTVEAIQNFSGAIPVLPIKETIKSLNQNVIAKTIDRSEIFIAQTPQIFNKDSILKAHLLAEKENWNCTDDSQVAELAGLLVTTTSGEEANIKITTPTDLLFAEMLYSSGSFFDK